MRRLLAAQTELLAAQNKITAHELTDTEGASQYADLVGTRLQLDQTQLEIKELEAAAAASKASLDAALGKQIANNMAEVGLLSGQLQVANELTAQLQIDIALLTSLSEISKQQIDAQKADNDAMKFLKTQLEQSLEKANKQSLDLSTQLISTQAQLDEKKHQETEAQNEAQRENRRADTAKNGETTAQTEAASAKEEVARIQLLLLTAKEDSKAAKVKEEDDTQRAETARNGETTAQTEAVSAKTELTKMTDKLTTLTGQLTTVTEKLAAAEQRELQLTQGITVGNEATALVAHLKSQIGTLKAEHVEEGKKTLQRVTQLTEECGTQQTKMAEQESSLADYADKFQKLQEELESNQKADTQNVTNLTAQLTASMKDVDTLTKSKDSLIKKLEIVLVGAQEAERIKQEFATEKRRNAVFFLRRRQQFYVHRDQRHGPVAHRGGDRCPACEPRS
jgi:hypothetical protein